MCTCAYCHHISFLFKQYFAIFCEIFLRAGNNIPTPTSAQIKTLTKDCFSSQLPSISIIYWQSFSSFLLISTKRCCLNQISYHWAKIHWNLIVFVILFFFSEKNIYLDLILPLRSFFLIFHQILILVFNDKNFIAPIKVNMVMIRLVSFRMDSLI